MATRAGTALLARTCRQSVGKQKTQETLRRCVPCQYQCHLALYGRYHHINTVSYNFSIDIDKCARQTRWQEAVSILLQRLPKAALEPDVVHVNSTINAFARSGRWRCALFFFHDVVPTLSIEPNIVTLGVTLNACATGSATAQALDLLLVGADDANIKPNAIVFNTVVHACARVGFWEGALHLLDEMSCRCVSASAVTFTAALSACKRGGQWRVAIEVLNAMAEYSATPDVVAFGAGISACEKGKQWQWALRLHHRMRASGIPGNLVTLSSVMSACASIGRWEQTLQLLEQSRDANFNPGAIAFSTALGGCEKGAAWEQALHLLREMPTVNVRPTLPAIRPVIGACESAEKPHMTLILQWDVWRCIVKQAPTSGANIAPLRGGFLPANSALHDYGFSGTAASMTFTWTVQNLVLRKLQQVSTKRVTHHGGIGEALAGRVHEVHDPLLEDLFHLGGACTRAAMEHLVPYSDASPRFEQGRADVRANLLGLRWAASKRSPSEPQLAVWVSSEIRMRSGVVHDF